MVKPPLKANDLDFVELVMSAEDFFEITISDDLFEPSQSDKWTVEMFISLIESMLIYPEPFPDGAEDD